MGGSVSRDVSAQTLRKPHRLSGQRLQEEKVMNEKDIINSKELESINSELFSAFDPGDESCIGGGGGMTNTEESTYMD